MGRSFARVGLGALLCLGMEINGFTGLQRFIVLHIKVEHQELMTVGSHLIDTAFFGSAVLALAPACTCSVCLSSHVAMSSAGWLQERSLVRAHEINPH